MKKTFIGLSIILGNFFYISLIHAQHQELTVVTKNYEQYLENTKNQCEKNNLSWSKDNSLVPVPQYPKLSSDAVNAQIYSPNLDNLSTTEKQKLKTELSMERIGNFSGFKTLEVARLQYRATMNSLFSCSIIEGRLLILADLREALGGKTSSEIQSLLDKEQKKLEKQKDQLSCQSAGSGKIPTMQELVNSATRQYCHFRHYLSYLDENLQNDRSLIENVEKGVGTGSGTFEPNTIQGWMDSYNNYALAIQTEITRADTTLPRVLKSYKEMERSYGVHLMLTIIYDDYIRLRKNLSTYMNASTQLYMKAYNAQDVNKR